MPHLNSSYLTEVMNFKTLPSVVTKLARSIRASGLSYSAIAFRGMSGALVVPLLCRRLKTHMLVIRKESENSHGSKVEGWVGGGPYIIVDDFICAGNTVNGIIETIDNWRGSYNKFADKKIEPMFPVGIFLYKPDSGDADGEMITGNYGLLKVYQADL